MLSRFGQWRSSSTALTVVMLATMMMVGEASAGVFGTQGYLAFDFINGGTAGNSELQVNGLSVTDGTIDSTPTFPQVDKDDDLNTTALEFEQLVKVTYGSSITFKFYAHEVTPLPNPNNVPDTFSFLLLDGGMNPLFDTSDPSSALFAVDVDGTTFGTLRDFGPSLGPNHLDIAWTISAPDQDGFRTVVIRTGANTGVVPEPTSIGLWSLAAMGLLIRRRAK